MGTSITVRDIDPGEKSCLRREARQVGVSMEELVRRQIPREAHEDRVPPEAVQGIRAALRGGTRRRASASGPLRQQTVVFFR